MYGGSLSQSVERGESFDGCEGRTLCKPLFDRETGLRGGQRLPDVGHSR